MTTTKEDILRLIATNDKAVARAVTVLTANQTSQEVNAEATLLHNGIGFNGVDAEILTSFSKQIARGRTLSPKQLFIARKKLPKYWKQLLTAAQKKEAISVHPPVQLTISDIDAALDDYQDKYWGDIYGLTEAKQEYHQYRTDPDF